MRISGAGTLRGSISSSSSSIPGQPPTTHPPTPPANMYPPAGGSTGGGGGTLLRQSSSPYRTPAPPINPPSVPGGGIGNYAPGQQQQPHPLSGIGALRADGGYAPGNTAMMSTPPVRMVQPLQQQSSVMYGGGAGASPLPPPMHDISARPYISGTRMLN